MNVLIACEFSGVARKAFRAIGHNAWSCDLLDAEDGSSFHLKGDVLDYINGWNWDFMIAHPPCQFLNRAGVRWLYKDGRRWIKSPYDGTVLAENPRDEDRWKELRKAASFFNRLRCAPIPRIAVENSEMHPYALEMVGAGPNQIIQPWQFGHPETKATCLWLKNLPPLKPTNIVEGRTPRVHYASPSPDRWKERSRTLPGIAAAMAEQWGSLKADEELKVIEEL